MLAMSQIDYFTYWEQFKSDNNEGIKKLRTIMDNDVQRDGLKGNYAALLILLGRSVNIDYSDNTEDLRDIILDSPYAKEFCDAWLSFNFNGAAFDTLIEDDDTRHNLMTNEIFATAIGSVEEYTYKAIVKELDLESVDPNYASVWSSIEKIVSTESSSLKLKGDLILNNPTVLTFAMFGNRFYDALYGWNPYKGLYTSSFAYKYYSMSYYSYVFSESKYYIFQDVCKNMLGVTVLSSPTDYSRQFYSSYMEDLVCNKYGYRFISRVIAYTTQRRGITAVEYMLSKALLKVLGVEYIPEWNGLGYQANVSISSYAGSVSTTTSNVLNWSYIKGNKKALRLIAISYTPRTVFGYFNMSSTSSMQNAISYNHDEIVEMYKFLFTGFTKQIYYDQAYNSNSSAASYYAIFNQSYGGSYAYGNPLNKAIDSLINDGYISPITIDLTTSYQTFFSSPIYCVAYRIDSDSNTSATSASVSFAYSKNAADTNNTPTESHYTTVTVYSEPKGYGSIEFIPTTPVVVASQLRVKAERDVKVTLYCLANTK